MIVHMYILYTYAQSCDQNFELKVHLASEKYVIIMYKA